MDFRKTSPLTQRATITIFSFHRFIERAIIKPVKDDIDLFDVLMQICTCLADKSL